MDHHIYDTIDRSELSQFDGQQVCFEGTVIRTTCPTPTNTYACLRNVRIAEWNDDVVFADRPQIHFDHIWLDLSKITHTKTRVTDKIVGAATVRSYERKDGTTAYGLVFEEKGLTEVSLMSGIVKSIKAIRERFDVTTLGQQKQLVDALVKSVEEKVNSGAVCFHDQTRAQFLAEFYKRKAALLRVCGASLPNNRKGRRIHDRYQRKGRSRPTAVAHGFA